MVLLIIPMMQVSPRVAIPKEFMMQPIGHPEKFVRYQGDEASLHIEVHNQNSAKRETGLPIFAKLYWKAWCSAPRQ